MPLYCWTCKRRHDKEREVIPDPVDNTFYCERTGTLSHFSPPEVAIDSNGSKYIVNEEGDVVRKHPLMHKFSSILMRSMRK